ncbi:MAG: hypothetical protein KatS3mg004_3759 [Bryobacteraceae bacterium]|nr:MAG: hypothetical protein KatS3mg004_3759 [Bryobacteraceae bacterium]
MHLADQGRGDESMQLGGCKEQIRLLDSEAPTTFGSVAALLPVRRTPHDAWAPC